MKKFLQKQKMMNHPVDIIYMDKKGHITYRTIFIKKITDDKIIAFCTLRGQQRTFELCNILAAEKGDINTAKGNKNYAWFQPHVDFQQKDAPGTC
ncbi:hypothetical protein GCM10010965_27020 [Caldalkalibacillus thermarum]|uniref:hypothetical protein n=1 Tax=Caldalkalibacillus thermarum TaxID=296745 RepID=UPI001666695B|nr:hypothetical protein [Caldalkalibacillus thermarum]GGK32726.1 hypothetical protein GCM10010965_27020 [Caldalkalibacillus thermarum]